MLVVLVAGVVEYARTAVSAAVQVDQRDLLGIDAPKPVVVEQQQVCSVKTRRGGEIVEVPIECTN